MNDVATSGRTVLFVSHNMAAVEALCTRGILLSGGRLVEDGPTGEVLQTYLMTASQSQSASIDLTNVATREPGRPALMRRVTIRDHAGMETTSVPMGSEIFLDVDFRSADPLSPVLGVVVKTSLGTPIFGIDNRMVPGFQFDCVRDGVITCRIADLPLTPGCYSLDLYLGDSQRSLDCVHDAIGLTVTPADVFGSGKLPPPNCGPICWPASWELTHSKVAEASVG